MAIPTRMDVSPTATAIISHNYLHKGSNNVVELANGSVYMFYIDSSADPGYVKSTDYGFTWGAFVQLRAGNCYGLSVWFDAWSGITATAYIHVAYIDDTECNAYYRNIDTANSDTLGSEVTVLNVSATSSDGNCTITRARGGNLYVQAAIYTTNSGYYVFKVSANNGGTWTTKAELWENVASDCVLLSPGWAADNQDIIAIYWDNSAGELSMKLYDSSANSWAETSIVSSVTGGGAKFSIAPDLTNSQTLVCIWSAVDSANADLRIWKITEAAQTELTNVVLNSGDDQAYCAISINANDWYVFYCGKSDGSEIHTRAVKLYYKKSSDGGSTWGAETSCDSVFGYVLDLITNPISYKNLYPTRTLYTGTTGSHTLICNIKLAIPRTTYQLGL